LTICHRSGGSVSAFQPSRPSFLRKWNRKAHRENESVLGRNHRPVRHRDSLARFVATEEDAVDIKDDTSSVPAKFWMDERQMNATSIYAEKEEGLGEPVYCYVNLDDISAPWTSNEASESTFIDYSDDGLILPAGPVGQMKEATANFLIEPFVEIVIASVVLLNSLLVALSTLDSLESFLPYIRNAEILIGTIFFWDFAARWFSSSRDRFGFVVNPQFVADVLVVMLPLAVSITPASIWSGFPSALTQPSGLFNLQLLRVLRLQRIFRDLDTFERFIEQATGRLNTKTYLVQDWQLQLARVVLSLFTLISVATGLIYTAEHTTNPNINNYFDALYFGLTTLTTVGFGDVSPVTTQGRIIVCGSILFGVAVVPAQAGALFEAVLDRENIRTGRMKKIGTKDNDRSLVNGRTNGSSNNAEAPSLALDTTFSCSRCGASFHWASARYCYRCGEAIDNKL